MLKPFAVGGKTPEEIEKNRGIAKKNFLALIACLMIGTAALPHILMRYYTTPSVHEARVSVFWGLFFIFLLYFTAPALAILAKYEVYSNLVGSSFSALPAWVSNWSTVDKTLMNIADINKDGIVQLAEVVIGGDLIVLATPEIAGLPYVISGLVAAGGLAAALSTADGLLLTIANAMSHDLYYKMIDPNASTVRRLAVSKGLLLVVALLAAYVTSLKPGDILFLVGAAFSLAASGFFPALVCGVFWKRANYLGAVLGMSLGLGVCAYYMYHDLSVLRRQCTEVVGHQPDLGRHLRHSRRLPGHHHRQPDFPGTEQGDHGNGRPCPLSEPGRRHRHQGRLITVCWRRRRE
jgi:cation/acetate symporter